VSHRSLLHSTLARSAFYGEPPSVFLLLSSIAFDSSVAGIFWSLTRGATLVVSEPRIEQDMERLGRCIAEHAVTHTLCLPSVYRLLLEHGDVADLRSLRTVVAAGEPLPPELVRRHREAVPQARLFNEYGPTEATVWCSVFDTGGHDGEGTVPIGRPIAGTRLYLLDGEGRPVPIGVPGEIHVAGVGLTDGYLNRPDATAERFVEHVIGGERIRVYRTGDLGCYRPDGNIEFLGRRDRQLKIRGFRVEPGEIEAALLRHVAVREAVVVSLPAGAGDRGSRAALVEGLRSLDPGDAEDILATIEACP
jgi:amino acid adenylation domain-containing protein